MNRPRSNALDTGRTIAVAGLTVADGFVGAPPGTVYFPAPGNPNFRAAHLGNRRAGHPMRGWKVHITAYPYNAQQVADAVLPVLHGMRIWHKYVRSAMDLSHMTEGQRGKFITVYTRDTDPNATGAECDQIVQALAHLLGNLAGPDVSGETRLSHMIFARFSHDYTRPGG